MERKTIEQRVERLESIAKQKPIFVAQMPRPISMADFDESKKLIEEELGDDYYVIVCLSLNNTFKFQCVNDPDLDEKSFEELKKQIQKSLK